MELDGFFHGVQLCADLLIEHARNHVSHNFTLARSERLIVSAHLRQPCPFLARDSIALKGLLDAVKQILFTKGLLRNSTAPAFIACTEIGMSPWPLMKMIGICQPARASSRCRSRPFSPGMRTSLTRHAGTSGRRSARIPAPRQRTVPGIRPCAAGVPWSGEKMDRRRPGSRRESSLSMTTHAVLRLRATRRRMSRLALFAYPRAARHGLPQSNG